MNPIELKLTLTKETKGTHVYTDEKDDSVIPTLYIRKSAFSGPAPKHISVKIMSGD